MHPWSFAAQFDISSEVVSHDTFARQYHSGLLVQFGRMCSYGRDAEPPSVQSQSPFTTSSAAKRPFLIWYFLFFFVSGFCSVLYELVWLRLSMAQFGVTTAMVSIVLSVFMAGLGLGSWASSKWLRADIHTSSRHFGALRLYALIELLIGISALVVPYELSWGRRILENLGVSSSTAYYCIAGLWVGCTLVPWCALMGATIPVAMRAIGRTMPREASRSFSYLYLANVTGAVAGTLLPLLLIEVLGFRQTLRVGFLCNCSVALGASLLSRTPGEVSRAEAGAPAVEPAATSEPRGSLLPLLFLTGLTSMGMEVVWVRQFTPYLGTVVYAFALILAVYLAATFMGSLTYRRWSARQGQRQENNVFWMLLALSALFSLVTSSPGNTLANGLRVFLGIAPFSGLLGFLTPMLVDRYSGGNPGKAGRAYAVNVLGCLFGPLLAGFFLLPYMSERWALIVLALPWLVVGLRPLYPRSPLTTVERSAAYSLLPLAGVLILAGKGYDESYAQKQVLRDSTATVIATGSGMGKQLLVNGYGMTGLGSITKMMAHLPLAFLDRPPQDALDICFGMGTTFRSLLSWKIHTTAVELVPSVPKFFGYFHGNGPELLRSPLAQVIIDDGRRYLERNPQQYDVITIDPPPPVEAAGSSMLYSEEFYAAARKRLRRGGILAQWLPTGDKEDLAAVARALQNSFPYVRVFRWGSRSGYHFLASEQPFPKLTAAELQRRLPPDGALDLAEWAPPSEASEDVARADYETLLQGEISIETMIQQSPTTPALSDDRPINEYFLLRRSRAKKKIPHLRSASDSPR
jgi:spermidine synthase